MEKDNPFDDSLPLFSLTIGQFKELVNQCLKENSVPTIIEGTPQKDIISIDELCEKYKLKKSTVYQLTFKKEIPYRKIAGKNYFSVKDVEAHWERQKIGTINYTDQTIFTTNRIIINIIDEI